MKLSILICSLESRKQYLDRLLRCLKDQVKPGVEIVVETDNGEMSIGAKRNKLLERAQGEYVAFVDDDDLVASNYVKNILNAIATKPDVVGIEGQITTDGKNPRKFIHSMKYKTWYEQNKVYYRSPNHLNPIKKELALSVKFPEKNHGEDRDYSNRLLPLLKSEAYVPGISYRYLYVRNKKNEA